MATVRRGQTNFTAGEVTERINTRFDINKYQNAVKEMTNFLPKRHGGADRRPGTRYVNEVKDSSKTTVLIPFEFNDEQAYVIELGNDYFRFYKDNGRIENAVSNQINQDFLGGLGGFQDQSTGTGVVTGTAGVMRLNGGASGVAIGEDNAGANEFDDMDCTFDIPALPAGATLEVRVGNSAGASDLALRTYTTTGTKQFSFKLTTTGFFIDFRTSFNGDVDVDNVLIVSHNPVEEVNSYLETELRAIKHAQSADTMYLVHREHVPATLVRNSETNWVRADISFTKNATTNEPTEFVTGANTNPGAVTFFEERLVFSSSTNNPQKTWASKPDDFTNMDPGDPDGELGILEDDSWGYTIGSNKVNKIRWLTSTRVLTMGTLSGEFFMSGGTNEAITPANVLTRTDTNFGTADLQPLRVNNVLLFLQRALRKIRELTFNSLDDAYKAPDLTLLAEHITKSGILDYDYQQEPDSIVYCCLNNGDFPTMTYERDQNVVAWARQQTSGEVESITVIPHPTLLADRVWMIVKRTINGNTKRYIEYIDDLPSEFELTEDLTLPGGAIKEKAVTQYGRQWQELYTDAALTLVQGTPFTNVQGLEHLEGETVDVIGDGAVQKSQVVTQGAITLETAVNEVEIGLHYDSKIIPLPIEVQGGNVIRGASIYNNEIFIQVLDSLGMTVNGEVINFRKTSDFQDQAPPLFTGIKKVDVLDDSEADFTVDTIVIEQKQPLPLKVLALYYDITVEEV